MTMTAAYPPCMRFFRVWDCQVLILHVGGTEQRIPAFSLLPNFQEGNREAHHSA